jgi:DNA-binding MarR family transcriptional regulator
MKRLYQSKCYCTNLRRSAAALSDYYDTALQKAGLTVPQYYLLINLSRLGSANITHWAQHVGLERSTMVRNVRVLQSARLIETAVGSGKTFTLTPQGRAALALAVPLWEQTQHRLEAFLGAEDTAAILRIGDKLQELPPL